MTLITTILSIIKRLMLLICDREGCLAVGVVLEGEGGLIDYRNVLGVGGRNER